MCMICVYIYIHTCYVYTYRLNIIIIVLHADIILVIRCPRRERESGRVAGHAPTRMRTRACGREGENIRRYGAMLLTTTAITEII